MIQLNADRYRIGTSDALELTEKYQTPLYVYDAAIIKRQYEKIKSAFNRPEVKIKYACKALSNLHVLKYIHSLGCGLDAVSIQEVWLGLKAGFDASQIMYTPNCVSLDEIDMAVKEGVQINIDTISILEQFGEKYGRSIPICIRINPHVMGGGNLSISTGHSDSKFGISVYQMRHVERIIKHYNLHITGLHMHTGSDILDVDVFLRAADILFETAQTFSELEFLDFGSGFKVAYKPDDYETDLQELSEKLLERFELFCSSYGKKLDLWFEPGKFLVSECGTFLVKVNVLKQTTSAMFVGVDSGFNHLIRPTLYNAYHHITNISNPSGKLRIYTIVGYICETDTFGWDRKLNEVHEGDILAFHNAGAYGYSMASNYNSRFRPAEVFILDGKDLLIRRRETMEDLLAGQ
jgi:diaminopimelate decarboxylase